MEILKLNTLKPNFNEKPKIVKFFRKIDLF